MSKVCLLFNFDILARKVKLQKRKIIGGYLKLRYKRENSKFIDYTEVILLFPAHGGDDGVFWIAFEDLLKYFDCIDICKVRPGWNEVRVTGFLPPRSSKAHQGCTLLTVLEPTEVEFTLFQEGQRNSERSQRSQLDLCVVVFRTTADGTSPQLGKVILNLITSNYINSIMYS